MSEEEKAELENMQVESEAKTSENDQTIDTKVDVADVTTHVDEDLDNKEEALDFSEDELSDLDENQFENFDESKIGREAEEPTIYNLPTFKKKQEPNTIEENLEVPRKVRKEQKPRRRRGKRSSTVDALNDELNELGENEEEVLTEQKQLDPTLAAKKELDLQMDAVLKPTRTKKRSNEDNLEQMADDEVLRLREQMRLAALRDAELNSEQLPATEKLKMLPLVDAVLRKTHLYDTILDNNVLDSVRMWLEPLPDRSLPALNIQRSLMDILTKLPIQTEHLRESKIGRIVLFYTISKKPEPFIKRIADNLVSEWSRPIIKRSANYRDRAVGVASFNPEVFQTRRRRDLAAAESNDDAQASRTGRTVIPRSIDSRYQVAPRVRLNPTAMTIAGRMKPADTEQVRKLKAKMKAIRSKSSKKSGVSIEGRGL
ncbi:transcription elongation factor complex subunit Iws1 [Schizosaccharomyces pombe]|uniref:Transcription factor iws1 n=1 Tax=Schizosaccharomyces pombe (strain 972 / ATCC 24843) TaxID=284812 RepID=IWS1_SCHPO|nr:putative transcription elongation factor complex subunit Iws1 [Schizosaccharomyces pombe]O42964.1 RecName: Full=Transcription factor iws1 [Schizosaccharomyces pombe 972h-]CAA17070.1 transcription elongation factor complex subunit Iws1 (predicted) [Schizosaccharomyces pombe]|eukprot:NP_595982.1 putative transcription elongation factor complex subunit Iws1 [Schizosaccharomyces pombe]